MGDGGNGGWLEIGGWLLLRVFNLKDNLAVGIS